MSGLKLKKYPAPKLTIGERWLDSYLVTFPVSYRPNGGCVIDGEYYDGVEVPSPIIPSGYTLKSIGVGMMLNQTPPVCTMYLKPIDGLKVGKSKLVKELAQSLGMPYEDFKMSES